MVDGRLGGNSLLATSPVMVGTSIEKGSVVIQYLILEGITVKAASRKNKNVQLQNVDVCWQFKYYF